MTVNVEKATEQLFVARMMAGELKRQNSSQKSVTYNDMVKSIQGIANIDKQWLMQQVNQNIGLRRAYQLLLSKLTFSYSAKQAAASTTEEFSPRKNDYFSIHFKRDKTFQQQIYVLLSIAHPLSRHINHELELHICDADNIQRLLFPPLSDGKTQQLLQVNNEALIGLLNANSELYLN